MSWRGVAQDVVVARIVVVAVIAVGVVVLMVAVLGGCQGRTVVEEPLRLDLSLNNQQPRWEEPSLVVLEPGPFRRRVRALRRVLRPCRDVPGFEAAPIGLVP